MAAPPANAARFMQVFDEIDVTIIVARPAHGAQPVGPLEVIAPRVIELEKEVLGDLLGALQRLYVIGLLGARYSQKHLLALIYLLRTLFIAVFLLVPVTAASTLVFSAAMGFLFLGVVPLVSEIIGRVFGLAHFNTLYGIVFLSHQVGSFFGAWMGGIVLDRAGNYDFAWGALIVIGIAAFMLQWLMDERPPRERKARGESAPAPA
jgi:MFS family permease